MPLPKFGFIQISGDEGGQILNISDAGLCFKSFAPIGNAKSLQFWFSLNLRDRIEANGQVAWLDAETKTGGLQFQNLTERAIKHIRTYATGGRNEANSEKGGFFAAALAKQNTSRASTESGSPQAETSTSPLTGIENSQFYRPVDRSKQTGSTLFTPVESTDLISLQRHLAVCRRRLVLGFVLGVLAASSVGLLLVPYVVSRARTAISQGGPAATSPEEQVMSQPATNPSAAVIPEMTRNSTTDNSLRMAASHSYDARLSRMNSTESTSPFFSRNADTSVTGAPRTPTSGSQITNKTDKTPVQLWSAVQLGDSNAAVVLADRYMRGDGVPVNCIQARVLLLVASERNNKTAIRKLHELDKNGCS